MAGEEKTNKNVPYHGFHLQLPTAEQNANDKLDGFMIADC